jgi:hypothetical protein
MRTKPIVAGVVVIALLLLIAIVFVTPVRQLQLSRFHLRVLGNKESAGLERLFMRLNMRFRQGQKGVSLNPLDKGLRAFSKPTVIVSDEFVEPGSNHMDQGASQK